MPETTYIAIDLKSFYASVECIELGLNPLTTNLLVADQSRTEKTICLAVSPSLKAYGIPGRPRLFEVVRTMREVNALRRRTLRGQPFKGETSANPVPPDFAVSYIVAPPQMALYIEYSTKIYKVYLQYIAPEDIHVYSIDEVFIDATAYLKNLRMTARELAMTIMRHVLRETGITATAGIGTNLYLAKVAMDIVAKKMPADADGVRIAELDERGYREQLWQHTPLTDFWRVGRGYAKKLAVYGMRTMGDIARFSLRREKILYELFGVNAELLIDHAWGWEPCTMADIKAYRPAERSISTGQVLSTPYPAAKAKMVVQEMIDLMALDLVEKKLLTNQLVLTLNYDKESLHLPDYVYTGAVVKDQYGRDIPKHAHGTANLNTHTSSFRLLCEAGLELFGRIMNPHLLVKKINLTACHVIDEARLATLRKPQQASLFDVMQEQKDSKAEEKKMLKERQRQQMIVKIRQRYGKNAILKGLNFEDGATTRERNALIGGHKA